MAEKTQEELAVENDTRIKLAVDDMVAMGMPPEEIDAELTRQNLKKSPKTEVPPAEVPPAPEQEQLKGSEAVPSGDKKAKEAADKAAADKLAADNVLQDMLFTKSREAKLKANEEAAAKAREARQATMTAEQIAAEDKRYEDALEAGRQKDVKIVSFEQNNAIEKLRQSMPADEWALIAPTLDEYVQSKADYDDVIFDGKGGFKPGVDYAKHIADLVTKARGANVDKIAELRLKKAEADKSVKKEIDNLQNLGGRKEAPGKQTPKSELDILKERALAGLQTSAEAERMVELMDKEK